MVIHRCAGLLQHLAQGALRHGRVFPGGGKALRQIGICVFEVGQPDIHIPGQGFYGGNGFIAAGIIGDRQRQTVRTGQIQGMSYLGQILRSSYKIDVAGPFALQPQKDLCQVLHGDGFADTFLADGIILAITAAKRAAAEKHSAAAADIFWGTAQAGLFPVMQGGTSHQQAVIGAAITGLTGCAVGTAGAGAEMTAMR
ncbi:hypothetical protein SUBVAR_05530 [Subdoligranulum variabile DSM 15176]|uniref:Uncharacterized protein n=1 Tax=Subdoligranulum variabile DSM 15176 TaxID=411471 RepID=D1PMG9_9FIRM|nr:hypothetical protein SUBVAR_05530 [Subdoligranulum variabile DSM 15176]